MPAVGLEGMGPSDIPGMMPQPNPMASSGAGWGAGGGAGGSFNLGNFMQQIMPLLMQAAQSSPQVAQLLQQLGIQMPQNPARSNPPWFDDIVPPFPQQPFQKRSAPPFEDRPVPPFPQQPFQKRSAPPWFDRATTNFPQPNPVAQPIGPAMRDPFGPVSFRGPQRDPAMNDPYADFLKNPPAISGSMTP